MSFKVYCNPNHSVVPRAPRAGVLHAWESSTHVHSNAVIYLLLLPWRRDQISYFLHKRSYINCKGCSHPQSVSLIEICQEAGLMDPPDTTCPERFAELIWHC